MKSHICTQVELYRVSFVMSMWYSQGLHVLRLLFMFEVLKTVITLGNISQHFKM